MELYDIYLELLIDGASSIAALSLWSGVVLIQLVGVGLWLPLALLRNRVRPTAASENSGDEFLLDWALVLAFSLAAGLATAVSLWTLSLFAFGSPQAGNFALLAIWLVSLGWAWVVRERLQFGLSAPSLWVLATLFAFALGLWHHAATELPVAKDGARLVFSDLHRDLGIHVNMAGLVRDGGLPMRSLWGTAGEKYWTLSHSGHLALIAGLSENWGISLYRAATTLFIVATISIAWGVLALFVGTGAPVALRFLVVGGTLVWGAFTFPDLHRIYDPIRELEGGGFELDAPGYWIAGRSFWNLPQILSISLSLTSLALFERFGARHRSDRSGLPILAAASFLIVAGGWVKPSLAVFYGPATILWLILGRAQVREYAGVLLILFLGFFVYSAPALLFDVPQTPSWTFLPNLEQSGQVLAFILMAAPALLVLALAPLVHLIQHMRTRHELRILDLALVAMGGSVLFALIFREDQFLGFRVFQPNIWWGMTGCITLLIPVLGREAIFSAQKGGWRKFAAVAGLSMALLQIFNGLCLAIAYPVLNLRGHAVSDAQVLMAARSQSRVESRFALDPNLQDYDLLAYLSRPVGVLSSVTPEADREVLESWNSFCLGVSAENEHLLSRFDAVVLHRDRKHVSQFLATHKWTQLDLPASYALWRAPKR